MLHPSLVCRALDHLDYVFTSARLRIWTGSADPSHRHQPTNSASETEIDCAKHSPRLILRASIVHEERDLMRKSLLSFALIAGLFLPMGAIHA